MHAALPVGALRASEGRVAPRDLHRRAVVRRPHDQRVVVESPAVQGGRDVRDRAVDHAHHRVEVVALLLLEVVELHETVRRLDRPVRVMGAF